MEKINLCKDCEYGRGYVELGICPVCGNGKLRGRSETSGLFCSNGCKDFPFAVSFIAQRNCFSAVYEKDYQIFITQKLSFEVLKMIRKKLAFNTVQLYKKINDGQPIAVINFLPEVWRIEAFFKELNISYLITPPLPYMSQKERCFPSTS
ncbi:MAG: hypothetical protein ACI4M3_08230 [Acutalibacteraceae bacterium]